MRLAFLVLFNTCFLLVTTAQPDTTNKWSFGANFFGNYTSGIISKTLEASNRSWVGDSYQVLGKASFSAHLFSEYQLTPKSRMGIGLGVLNLGEIEKFTNTVADSIDPQVGFVGARQIGIQNNFNLFYLEVPLYFKYYFGKHFYGLAGVSGSVLLQEIRRQERVDRNTTEIDRRTNGTSNVTNTFRLSSHAALGVEFLENKKRTFFAQAQMQYGITQVYKVFFVDSHPLSLGIATGVRF